MPTFRKCRSILAAALLALWGAAIAAAPLPAFTAHYRLLRDGSQIGTATVTLAKAGGDTWTYTTQSRGTSGLASLLGARIDESSTFSWAGGLPQGISYDYSMKTAIKQNHRDVRFDWAHRVITVDDKGSFRYPAQPGALERHTVPLALAAGLASGKQSFTLPVAVRNRIEMQHYIARGKQSVSVPAGSFEATPVVRTDGGDAFTALFAPGKLPVPVKIEQRGKDDLTLELESWSTH
jgi:hypothetical protein